VTVIFFAGPRLDHGPVLGGRINFDFAPAATPPPIVVRGYGVTGYPVSLIRAGQRVDDAVEKTTEELASFGFDPASQRTYWVFPARDARGNVTSGFSQWIGTATDSGERLKPPFSFQPHAVIPMPNGWLFCTSAPLGGVQDLALGFGSVRYQYSGVFRQYYRVYRRNGDWVQDFPDLHGAPIQDAYWDGGGNCFVAGDEVGEERYSFRKYNSAYELQWSVSFSDYWPLSTEATRTTQTDFNNGRAQFDHRRASVKIEPAPDGSFFVLSEVSLTNGYMFGNFRYYTRAKAFFLIARVSASGETLWVRVAQRSEGIYADSGPPSGEPQRESFSCRALPTHQFVVFFVNRPPIRYSVGIVGGDYLWDRQYQVTAPNPEQVQDGLLDLINWQNGLVINGDGSWSGHLFPHQAKVLNDGSTLFPKTFTRCIMRYADERLTVWSRRIRWGGEFGDEHNVDPEYVRHVFYQDLTLLSAEEIPPFDHLEAVAVAEDRTVYRGARVAKVYENAYLPNTSQVRNVLVAMHFTAEDVAGDPVWDGITATARLGVTLAGRVWREIDANLQAAHDDFVVHTTAHGGSASGDLIRLTGGTDDLGQGRGDFWLPATAIAIAYDSPPPALALPVFLKRPNLLGPVNTLPPGLPLPFALGAPLIRREYVGALARQIYRLTLGDLEIPFSTLIARKTAFEVTVIAICPAASEPLVAAIVARDGDTLTVWRGVRFPDGSEQLEPMLRGALAGIRYDRGARSGSITLDVRQEPSASKARTRTLAAVSRRDRRSWSSPLPDIFLNPGDTVAVGALSFTAGAVEYLINPNEARMTVGEAE
jgi:hypothetical protein